MHRFRAHFYMHIKTKVCSGEVGIIEIPGSTPFYSVTDKSLTHDKSQHHLGIRAIGGVKLTLETCANKTHLKICWGRKNGRQGEDPGFPQCNKISVSN